MPDDSAEIIGGVGVSITGDYSQLSAQFTDAQNAAQQAGENIADAFTTAAAGADTLGSAAAGAATSVDDFASAASGAGDAAGGAAPGLDDLATAADGAGAALVNIDRRITEQRQSLSRRLETVERATG